MGAYLRHLRWGAEPPVGLTAPSRTQFMPYPKWTYPARGVWEFVQLCIWPFAWKRIYFLRPALLKLFGASLPSRCNFGRGVKVYFPWLLSIGRQSVVSDRVDFYNLGGVSLGNRVIVSQDVYFCGGTHDYTLPEYPLKRLAIIVEDDVWIGAGAFIGPGVRIGQGAVVGARAVVSKDVPAWKVVAGNPARVIKDRVLRAT
jgi:putative colanic acid biosynthesis acetyltransferase WcaF